MKIPNPFLFLIAALLALGVFTPRHASAQVSVGYFYDTLSPYGEWVYDPDYGYVWHPTNVDDNWAPYTDGYWAYTDAGWTWVSYEDYGGVVYHYGRWAHLPGEGWVWVPGYTWAPAWVSWRSNDDYVGWAPLPPEARWSFSVGFSGWADARFNIGPGFYSFVGIRDFGAPALGAVIVNREQNVTIINNTTNITNITTNNSTVYVGGPSYATIAAHSSRPIPTLKLVRQRDASLAASEGGKALSRQKGNELIVLAPKLTAPPAGEVPAPPKVAKRLTAVKADHGWDIVKDPQERETLQAKIKSQAPPENTPAKPVKAEDLRVVNEKIKTGAPTAEEAGASTETGKEKGRKSSSEDLLNAPATEEGGSANAEPTPRKKKSKHPSSEYGGAEENPTPKKSKKAKTPSEYDESGASEEATPKHRKSGESDLEPFTSGDESSGEKSRESSEYSNKESSDRTGGMNAQEQQPKKKSKKNKQEAEQGFTPGQ